jgi:hypothetical protein
MHFNARASFVLLAGSFAVATACGEDRKFPGGGGEGGGDAGETSEPGGGTSNRAGSSNRAGGGSGGDANSSGAAGEAGTTSGDAGAGGEAPAGGTGGTGGTGAGAGGMGGAPACGAPGTACCSGSMCVTNATCTTNTCACSPSFTSCGNACINLKNDPQNCGACGHSCLGGVCDLGTCQPKTVATGQSRLNQMATDGAHLYWSGTLTGSAPYYVARARVDGSGTVKVIAANEQSAGALAVTPDKVFWNAKGQLRSCDIPDCIGGPLNAISGATSNGVNGDILYEPGKKALYWSRGATYNTKDGTLYSLASGALSPTVVGTNPSNPGALVSDASNVYWINSSTYASDTWNADGGVWRVRVSDGVTTQLASTLRGDISHLAIGGSALFFAGNIAITGSNPLMTTTAILRAPLPNGLSAGAQPKFADSKNVRGLEADDQHLYFADESGSQGSISRCPIAACPTPETIVPGLYAPHLGAQDAVSIYFSSSASGSTLYTIQRLAK